MTRPTYSFIVPVFNEEAVLPHLFQRLHETIQKINEPCEVVFVDDGSSDKSYEILRVESQQHAHFRVIKFSRNFGHQNAVTAGMDYAQGQAVIIMDADLQDPPEVVFDLIAQWKAGFHIVHAVRESRAGESWFKLFTANLFYRFLDHITDTKIIRNSGDFRLMDRRVVNVFKTLTENNRFIRGLSAWVGFKQSCVFYKREARFAGETKYPLKRMLRLAANAITSFSDWPLRLCFNVGLLVSFVSFLTVVFFVIGKFLGRPYAPGWMSIIMLTGLLNGLTMIMVGTVGIYVGRIFQEIKKRPLYIVDDETTEKEN
jgi:glycosyltransferase involved in cell wall biosynthesis